MGLHLKDLSVGLGRFELRVENLEVPRGTLCTVLGKSGSGKTTLFNAIAGFEPIRSGSISIDGKRLEQLPPEKRQIALVFQHSSLFPHLTVLGNVEFGLKIQKMEPHAREQKCRLWLEKLQMGELSDRYPHQISGGQAQRVALARSLVTGFPVLLLDEPFTGLDLGLRKELFPFLKQLVRQSHVATLMVTHDPLEALDLSDYILVLEDGIVVQQGAAQAVKATPHPSLKGLLGME